MTIFLSTVELVLLVCLMITLSTGNCKKHISGLNCAIISKQNIDGIVQTKSRKIPAINSCTKGYKNEDIISKCERLINWEQASDLDLFSPVTNSVKNVTYWNKYCATCNNDNEPKWQPWLPWPFYKEREPFCQMMVPIIQRSDVDDLYELTQIFINQAGVKLIATLLGNIELECSIEGNWPIHLLHQVIPCLIHIFRMGQYKRSKLPCQYAEKAGRICTKMRLFMDGLSSEADKDETMNYGQTLYKFNVTQGEYMVESGYEDVFYICEKTRVIYGTGHWAKISFSIISLIFIIIYLGVNFNKEYFRNMANKMLYSYMVGLMVTWAILLFIYLSYAVPCVAFYLAQFLWFFHFVWTLLIFVEFCSLVYCTCHKWTASDGSWQRKRYIFYTILGSAVVPVATPIFYYYGVLVTNEHHKGTLQHTCLKIAGHLSVSCVPYQKSGAEHRLRNLDDILSSSFYFLIPALFLSGSVSMLIHIAKFCCKRNKSIPQKDHLIVLAKMTSIMGVHWVLREIYARYGGDYSFTSFALTLDTVCQSSIDFHGVIIFIVFGIGNCMNWFGRKFERVSQQDMQLAEHYRLSAPRTLVRTNEYFDS